MAHKARSIKPINRSKSRERYDISDLKADMYSNRAQERVEDMYSAFYGGIDPRRRQEMADGGMVKEDINAMANLSPRFIHQEYAAHPYYSNPFIDDSVME
jgi:hypothetical protein